MFEEILREFGVPIGVLLVVLYFTYTYFTKELQKKDTIIAGKDDEIKGYHEKYVSMMQSVVETTTEMNTYLKIILDKENQK